MIYVIIIYPILHRFLSVQRCCCLTLRLSLTFLLPPLHTTYNIHSHDMYEHADCIASLLTHFFFIPTASITEQNCPNKTGRVRGISFPLPSPLIHKSRFWSSLVQTLELSQILYAHSAMLCFTLPADLSPKLPPQLLASRKPS